MRMLRRTLIDVTGKQITVRPLFPAATAPGRHKAHHVKKSGTPPLEATFCTKEFTVRKHFKFALAIVLTVITTFIVTAHFTAKNTWKLSVAATFNVEAFNDISRVKTWDDLEQLMLKGCHEEALEYVRVQQTLALSALKYHLDQGAELDAEIADKNRSIVSRAEAFERKEKYDIPTCGCTS